jgi:protease secretion system outer membrane protein
VRHASRTLAAVLVAAGTAAACQPVHACGLAEAFAAAQAFDPNYDAARADLESERQNVPMARAGLLPNISYNSYDAKVTGERNFTNIFGQPVESDLDYAVHTRSVGLRAPLLDMEALQKYRGAKLQAQAAEAFYATRGSELSDRLAIAYLRRLLADEELTAAQARLDAAREQAAAQERSVQLGEGTLPERELARAELGLAQANLDDARDQRELATLGLAQLTGREDTRLCTLRANFRPPPLEPAGFDGWLQLALRDNPAMVARRLAVERADALVEQQRAGHYPSVALIASVAKNENDTIGTLGQSVFQRSVGVQVHVPITQFGYVNAAVAQAIAQRDKAQAELRAEEYALTSELRTLHATLEREDARLRAQVAERDAAALALEGARRGFARGQAARSDVEIAERRLAEAVRDLAKARFETLLARLQLFTRAGIAPETAVARLDAWLDAPVPQ